MKATLIVRAGFVPYLRKGLFGEWGYAYEQLANLSLQLGSAASVGAYSAPMLSFFTILILLFEIGLHDNDPQGEVVVNLAIGGPYVVKGLRQQHLALEDQLAEMPKRTRKAMRDAAAAQVAEFGAFVKEVEERVDGLNRRPERPATTHPPSRPPLRAKPSQAHRSQH